jgi:UDP-GlcNAc3NAcA epimerase
VLVTVHRAENTDHADRLLHIFSALEKIVLGGMKVIVPLHPRTRKNLESFNISFDNLTVIEPVSYLDMLLMEKQAQTIITDSGGIQKEAFFFKVPCITLRSETEWVETVRAGWNVLVDIDEHKIFSLSKGFPSVSNSGKETFGDGRAAEKISAVFGRLL